MKKGLGRGIDALFSDTALDADSGEQTVRELPIRSIDPNPDQPRLQFNAEALANLADSIRSLGVLQPICVLQNGDRFTLVAGERRWRAAMQAGLVTIPAIVRDFDRMQRMEAALVENLQRTDLTAIESARAIRELMNSCGMTQDAVASRIGRSRPAVANLLRLLTLPEPVQEMVLQGELGEAHARALVTLPDPKKQKTLALYIVEHGLNARQAEIAAAAVKSGEPIPAFVQQRGRAEKQKKDKSRPEGLQVVEEAARNAFGTKVELLGGDTRGRLVVHYYSRDDLERIFYALGGRDEE